MDSVDVLYYFCDSEDRQTVCTSGRSQVAVQDCRAVQNKRSVHRAVQWTRPIVPRVMRVVMDNARTMNSVDADVCACKVDMKNYYQLVVVVVVVVVGQSMNFPFPCRVASVHDCALNPVLSRLVNILPSVSLRNNRHPCPI